MKTTQTRKLTLMAMISAMAYLVMLVGRIPIALGFLSYDPKDAVLAIGGFLLGPVAALVMTVVVAFVEMLTVSSTGWIGFAMNALSTCAFVLPAAILYNQKRTLKHAIVGLGLGIVFMTALMLAWNVILTPLYMGVPREAITALLLPVFLPFNAVKGLLNAGIVLLIYKPVSEVLKRMHMLPETQSGAKKGGINIKVVLLSLFIIATAVACFVLLSRS